MAYGEPDISVGDAPPEAMENAFARSPEVFTEYRKLLLGDTASCCACPVVSGWTDPTCESEPLPKSTAHTRIGDPTKLGPTWPRYAKFPAELKEIEVTRIPCPYSHNDGDELVRVKIPVPLSIVNS